MGSTSICHSLMVWVGFSGGRGDWMTSCTERGIWQNEHWVLHYMLANRTPIKKIYKKRNTIIKGNKNKRYVACFPSWMQIICLRTPRKLSGKVTEHERLLTLENKQGVMEGKVGGGMGWLGDEWGTWWDEHWVICYMLANWTPIKKIIKEKKRQVEILRTVPGT